METKIRYFIYRHTVKNGGWNCVRHNIENQAQADDEFDAMKKDNPSDPLRIVQISETIIREE